MMPKNYIFPAVTDYGTVLEPDQVAVTYDEDTGYKFLIPDRDDDAEIPDKAAALISAAVRLDEDEDFCNEMLKWFEERQAGSTPFPRTLWLRVRFCRNSFRSVVQDHDKSVTGSDV